MRLLARILYALAGGLNVFSALFASGYSPARGSAVVIGRVKRLFRASSRPAAVHRADSGHGHAANADVERLRQVRRGLVDVVASRRRLEYGLAQLHELATRELQRAERAMAQEREDEARFYLAERQDALAQADELRANIEKLLLDEQQLHRAQNRLRSRMRVKQAREDSSSARLLAARTAVSVNEALAAMTDAERVLVAAAEDREREARELSGRSRALGDLLDEGHIRDPSDRTPERDALLRRDFRRLGVEAELAELRQRGLAASNTLSPDDHPEKTAAERTARGGDAP